ncbi:hypothetical protein [Bradyrhizobium sp. LB12.1]|uniref:hypothetical protein n=1 Tax=Bradyrhizobium sp. LB12.1 TaxID=3156327 RepID=UPI00339638E0
MVRIPFNIYGPDEDDVAPLILSGDLGMAFAGNAVGALMVKEALAEVLVRMQAVPSFHDYSMEGIADFVFRAYRVISAELCATILEHGRTCIVFAGYCAIQKRLRAFRIETDHQNFCHKREVLVSDGQHEAFGSGASPQLNASIAGQGEQNIVQALLSVIDDPAIPGVGGNVQYGRFKGSNFQTLGVAKLSDDGVHYWRGPLDLNGPDFDQSDGLIPNFPLLNMIG